MAPDGSGVRRIGDASGTGDGYTFNRLSWSPDGKRVASQVGFSSTDILAFDVEDGTVTRITDKPYAHEFGATYAPDGALAWFADVGVPCCLNILEPGGEVVNSLGGSPVWSPDGKLIATQEEPLDTLVIVDRAGSVVARIADAVAPSWQRVAS